MRLRLILAAAAVMLTACGEASQPAPAPAPAPPPPPPLTAEGPFKATKAGVGAVTAETRFDLSAVEKAFPGAKAEATWIEGEKDLIPVLTVTGEHGLSMDVLSMQKSTGVGVIAVYGGPVVGPDGEKIGARRSETPFTDAQCAAGAKRYAGKTLCRRADDPNTIYVFKGSGPSAKIEQIRWQAPGSGSSDDDKQALKLGGGKVR